MLAIPFYGKLLSLRLVLSISKLNFCVLPDYCPLSTLSAFHIIPPSLSYNLSFLYEPKPGDL